MWTEPWYIPCSGVKLEFKDFCLIERDDRSSLSIVRTDKNSKRRVFQKHLTDPGGRADFRRIGKTDFEIEIGRDGSGGPVDLTEAHVFSFLLMIKNGGWLHAPTVVTSSIFEEPQDDIFCFPFLPGTPCNPANTTLSSTDAEWIRKHLQKGVEFTEASRFQNAMQALTSFHCIPFSNFRLLTAWTGLEALFQTQQEISFRLSLYISNYIRDGEDRRKEFDRLRESYTTRSKIAHGSGTKAREADEQASYARDILRECLQKSLEDGHLPNTSSLAFT